MFQIQKASRIALRIIHVRIIPACLSNVSQYWPMEKNVFFPAAARQNTLVKSQQALHSCHWNSSFALWLHIQTLPSFKPGQKKKKNKSMNNFKQGTCLATVIWLFRCTNWRKSELKESRTWEKLVGCFSLSAVSGWSINKEKLQLVAEQRPLVMMLWVEGAQYHAALEIL